MCLTREMGTTHDNSGRPKWRPPRQGLHLLVSLVWIYLLLDISLFKRVLCCSSLFIEAQNITFPDTIMSLFSGVIQVLRWNEGGIQMHPQHGITSAEEIASWCFFWFFFFSWRCSIDSWTRWSLLEYLCFDALSLEGTNQLKLCRLFNNLITVISYTLISVITQKIIFSSSTPILAPARRPSPGPRARVAPRRSRWRPSPWNSPFSQRGFALCPRRGTCPGTVSVLKWITKRERCGINNEKEGSLGISESKFGIGWLFTLNVCDPGKDVNTIPNVLLLAESPFQYRELHT